MLVSKPSKSHLRVRPLWPEPPSVYDFVLVASFVVSYLGKLEPAAKYI